MGNGRNLPTGPRLPYAGTMSFITEKDTEAYLEQETREVRMPDGSLRPVRLFKLVWRSFDYILATSRHIQEEDLTGWGLLSAQETGRSFDLQFPNVLAYTHRALRKQQGID